MSEKESIDWRALCAAASVEEDSTKLATLVDQIIKTLDRAQTGGSSSSISVISSPQRPTERR